MMQYQLEDDKTFIGHEEGIAKLWDVNNVYDKLIEERKNSPKVLFMDGPPFPSSKNLHYGHILIGNIKSTYLFYTSMNGFNFVNKLGYDTHGLPIEMCANKELHVTTRREVENKITVSVFNQTCRNLIKSYTGAWEPIYKRTARWAKFDQSYQTLDLKYMETVWWIFKELYRQGLVYKSRRIMPYSIGCGTPLSNFEASQAYRDVKDKTIYVKFPLKTDQKTNLIIWTTTPWTLPCNIAVCMNPDEEYAIAQDKTGEKYIVLNKCIKNLQIKDLKVLELKKGKLFEGLEYIPPFTSFTKRSFRVICDKFVESNNMVGTGLVHIAPQHGEEDYRVCIEKKVISEKEIDELMLVDDEGLFKYDEFKGIKVFEADEKIIDLLKKQKKIVRVEMHTHNYPFCYRTDEKLIYKPISGYFIKVTALKDKLIANNKKIKWMPESVGSGRFESWLENTKDWNISRNRFFGSVIPIWSNDSGEEVCIGSIDELVQLAELKERPTDLHMEYIEKIIIPSKRGGNPLRLSGQVFDCWFESGCVPFAQLHYPFEHKDSFDNREYLSDFVTEGLDQTRGWFYTLLVISTAILNKPPFKNVLCAGLIMDKEGKKLSKKYGNFQDPMEIISKNGSDILRLYLLGSPAVKAEALYFNDTGMSDMCKRIIPWYNSMKFLFEHYTNFCKKGNKLDMKLCYESKNMMDKWILSKTGSLINSVSKYMSEYQLDKAIHTVVDFIEILTNWYLRINRERLRGIVDNEEWKYSISTLFNVQLNYTLIMAPFMPFLCEHFYQKLKMLLPENKRKISVFLCDYPDAKLFTINNVIETRMQHFLDAVMAVRYLRGKTSKFGSLKVPIKKVIISHDNTAFLSDIRELEELFLPVVNCLEIEYISQQGIVTYTMRPNMKQLGQKYRAVTKQISDKLPLIPSDQVKKFSDDAKGILTINVANTNYIISKDDVMIVPEIKTSSNANILSHVEKDLLVMIDTTWDQEVVDMYNLKLLVYQSQLLRKRADLKPWNKIKIIYQSESKQMITLINKEMKFLLAKLVCDVTTESITADDMQKTCFHDDVELSDDINISITIVVY